MNVKELVDLVAIAEGELDALFRIEQSLAEESFDGIYVGLKNGHGKGKQKIAGVNIDQVRNIIGDKIGEKRDEVEKLQQMMDHIEASAREVLCEMSFDDDKDYGC